MTDEDRTAGTVFEQDVDPAETQEWLEALVSVLEREGVERAHYLVERLVRRARRRGARPGLITYLRIFSGESDLLKNTLSGCAQRRRDL